jgi:uncharacterized low-complexity protein
MSKKSLIATAVGSAFVASMAAAPIAAAAENPFALSGLSSGYQVADNHVAKPVEGKCGGKTAAEMKAKEGKCGNAAKMKDGKCGEGKCGAAKKDAKATEMKPADKKMPEGKCGEGKCGATKKTVAN